MKCAWILASALCVAGAANAAQKLQQPSEIVFGIRQMGVPVEGRFKTFEVDLAFDPAKPQQGKVRIKIDTASATLGVADLDAELPKTTWLGATKFPQALFQSTSIRAIASDRFEVNGKLNIKGIERDATIPVRVVSSPSGLTATGTFTIHRLDHKVGEGDWSDTSMVANDLQIRFSFSVTGTPNP